MRRPRRKTAATILAALLVLAALATLAFWLLPASAYEVSMVKVASVKLGMTEAEVAELLGPPIADRSGEPLDANAPMTPGSRHLVYEQANATVAIVYSSNGRADWLRKDFRKCGPFERLRLRIRGVL